MVIQYYAGKYEVGNQWLTCRLCTPCRTSLFGNFKEISNFFLVNFAKTLCINLGEVQNVSLIMSTYKPSFPFLSDDQFVKLILENYQ